MTTLASSDVAEGRLLGASIDFAGEGAVELTRLLNQNSETSVYAVSRPDWVVKAFHLECGSDRLDEVSYGPYLSYKSEVENFEDIQRNEELRACVPAYYGSTLDPERKVACIAMEFLEGQNLLEWCRSAADREYPEEWTHEFRRALFETFGIVKLFHERGIILIDFKPDNVIRLENGGVKFVDLGAFFTPRHGGDTENYVYLATPDYAELVIDTSNIQTGLPLTQISDIFSAGVALFEMATGGSRLIMADETAEAMLAQPSVYRFRDSQIKDIWKTYPHLEDLLPLAEAQLQGRCILFSEFWHLLKGYLATEVPNWETMSDDEHRQILLDAGTSFVGAQLPEPLQWLAEPIARATTLRSYRFQNVSELMDLIADPVSTEVQEDIKQHNTVVEMALALDPPVAMRENLNAWESRLNPQSGHWALAAATVAWELRRSAPFIFLKAVACDEAGHRFYEVVGDLEADDVEDGKLTLVRLGSDRMAWISG